MEDALRNLKSTSPRSQLPSRASVILGVVLCVVCVCLVSTGYGGTDTRSPRTLIEPASTAPHPRKALHDAHVDQWDLATQAASPLHDSQCDLCAQNWLFILAATGRTGSTSALSMFSRVPGFELLGEHKGFLTSQRDAVEELRAARDFWVTEIDSPSWRHSDVDMHSVYCNIQDLVQRVLLGSQHGQVSPKVLGFKEIRYTNMKMMPFLASVFPCAKFVFTMRETPPNTGPQAAPWVKYEKYEEKTQFVKKLYSMFNGTTTALLPLETRSVEDYNKILHDMLGVRGCQFTQSLHDNAGGGYKADKRLDVIEGDCDLSGVDFRLDEQTIQRNAALWAELQQSGEHEGF